MTVLWKANHNGMPDCYGAGFTRVQIQNRTGVTSSSTGTAGGITTSSSPNNPVPGFNHPKLGNCLAHTLKADMATGVVNYRQECYRHDVANNLVDGSEMYFRFDFAVPSNFPVAQGNYFLCINQIHTANPNTSPPLEFDIYNGGLYTRGYNWETKTANVIRNKLTDVAPGEVYSVAYYIKCSSVSANNRISVWVNGVQVLTDFNPGFSLLDGGASYWKGSSLYADAAITRQYGDLTIYQANHTAATALADVLVAPTPAPVDPTPVTPDPIPITDTVTMPSDFAYAEVELSTTADFANPIILDRLSGAGTAIATDLSYGTTYWVRMRSVDWAGNKSEYSEVVQGVAEKVANVDLGPDSVDRAQIRDLAVGNAQIDNLAVNDAKIANLSVGKLQAGQLNVEIVTLSGGRGKLSTSSDVNNRVVFDSQGVYSYVGGALKFWLRHDGESLFTGQLSTAASGRRITLNPNGAIPDEMRFYRMDADNYYGRIRIIDGNGGAGINIRPGGPGFKAELYVRPENVALLYGDIERGIHRSRVVVDNDHSYISSPIVDISSDMRYPHDGVGYRVSFFNLDVNGFLIKQSVVEYYLTGVGTANTVPIFAANNRDVGIKFWFQELIVCTGDSAASGFRPIRASAHLLPGSSREIKQNFVELPEALNGHTALEVINACPITQWEYIEDSTKAKHIGPIAEDVAEVAPALLVHSGPQATLDAVSQAHVAWAGIQDLSKEVRELRAEVKRLGNGTVDA